MRFGPYILTRKKLTAFQTIASAVLGDIQQAVSLLEHRFENIGKRIVHQPHADGHGELPAGKPVLTDGLQQSLRYEPGLIQGNGEKNAKLLASEAAKNLLPPEQLLDQTHKLDQHLITNVMAIGVIDLLEMNLF